MIKKQFIGISMIFVMLMSNHVMANAVSNPIKNSLAITEKYMPKAFAAMWQSEHLLWRAQLFKSACDNNNPSLKYALNAGFPLVEQFIYDQALINGDFNYNDRPNLAPALTDEATASILHDTNKLYYRIFSDIFAYGYISRLQIVQHFHPEISIDLCSHAKKIASEHPIDEVAISPWKTKKNVAFESWQVDLFSVSVLSKYFSAAYIARQKPFAHIIDAKIYAMMQQNEPAEKAFSTLTNSYEYSRLLVQEITQAHNDDKGEILPKHQWRATYAFDANVWATQAYTLATISALRQVNELYPELTKRIEAHKESYIALQLTALDESKRQLGDMLK